jgi:alkylation response protein AidB-like acyl-CoA dehydrogenase
LPFVAAALESGFVGATAGGVHLNSVAPQYFDVRKVSIYGGTNEVQKNLIARSVLGF